MTGTIDWASIAVFAVGALAHFVYNRFLTKAGTPPVASPPSAPMASLGAEALPLLASFVHKLLDNAKPPTPTPAPTSDPTTTQLMQILSQVISNGLPQPTVVAVQSPPTSQGNPPPASAPTLSGITTH